MKPTTRPVLSRQMAQVAATPRWWTWGALFGSVFVCLAIAWIHLQQRRTIGHARDLIENVREARIDLAKGFLYTNLAEDATAPYSRDQGLALLRQAVEALRDAIASAGPADEQPAGGLTANAEFESSLRGFLEQLSEAVHGAERSPQAEARLRIAFYVLERAADAVDTERRTQFDALLRRADRDFYCTLAAAAALLACLCGGMYLAARAQARALEALRQREDQLRLLGDNLPDSYVYRYQRWADGTARFIYVSAGVERLHGIMAEAALGDPRVLHELMAPDQLPGLRAAEELSRRELRDFVMDLRMRHANGGWAWFHVRSHPRLQADGSCIWDGVVTDVTAHKQAELALQESEARFRQVLENIREVFWMADVGQQRLIYLSPSYAHIWGRPLPELPHPFGGWPGAIHPEDQDRVRQALAEHPSTGEYDVVYRILRPDGLVRWIRDRAFPILDHEGTAYRIAGLAEDITEQRRLEEQYRQAQKMEAIGQLASGVAHDFNNLLTVIHGNVSMIPEPEAAALAEYLQPVLQAAEQAAGLTRQLLLFGRRQKLQPTLLELNTVITTTARMLTRIVGEDVSLHTELAPRLPSVCADAGTLEQCLLNLVVNARDAMPRGGSVWIRTAFVHVDAAKAADVSATSGAATGEEMPGDWIRLSVEDSGIGIAEEVLPHIFEPFFTTKDVGKGSGLGLAMVYGVVKEHGGWITTQSALGRGTTFHLHFPPAPAGPEQTAPATSSLGMPAPMAPREEACKTILLVEDEPAVRGLACHALERQGYRVLHAASGPEALELWAMHRDQIELLLTDMVMPQGISGLQLSRRLVGENPQLKVIHMSGYSPDLGGDHPMIDGVNFIQKPFTAATLVRVVRQRLEHDA